MSFLTASFLLSLMIPTLSSLSDNGSFWVPFSTELPIPSIIDMRHGGEITLMMKKIDRHYWGGDKFGHVLGYGVADYGAEAEYPGPTILAARNVPFKINWRNEMFGEHILKDNVEPSLLYGPTKCYPSCGIPSVVHTHGLEAPAEYDGLPLDVIYAGEEKESIYYNSQSGRTLLYHAST